MKRAILYNGLAFLIGLVLVIVLTFVGVTVWGWLDLGEEIVLKVLLVSMFVGFTWLVGRFVLWLIYDD